MSSVFEPALDRNQPVLHSHHPLPVHLPDRRSSRGLRRLLAFCVVVVATMAALHVAITWGLRRIGTSDFGVSNRIVRGQINAEIVVTGSSRALTHCDPRIISAMTGMTVYNL